MDLWYREHHTENVQLSMRVRETIATATSEFQRIDIFDSPEFGRVLALDGYLMLTEKDEFIYHEMISHVPMAVNPAINDVLVIGAGDGRTVRELCKYNKIRRIDLVEIDKMVVDLCREHLPQTASSLSDSRVNIFFEDGLKFVRSKFDEYDLIIVDSTDPFGPGEGLFTKEFYGNCYSALRENGILVNQHESPFYDNDALAMQRASEKIRAMFPKSFVYQAHIPTYPSGHWLFGFASKGFDPIADLNADSWNELGIATKYYNTELHVGSFALPNYVKWLLETPKS